MKKFFLLMFFLSFYANSQIDKYSLVGTPSATTDQLVGITSPKLGSLAFDTEKDRLVEYTTEGWKEILTTGNIYVGAFIMTGTGTQVITGLPFKPSQITFVAHANIEVYNLDSDNGVSGNNKGVENSFGSMNGFARDNAGAISQQVIYSGGNGGSINNISRYASNSHCIGLRYSDNNGEKLGLINASLSNFNADGFTISITKSHNRVEDEDIVVKFTAYR
ncbi:MAG: hypothetical protein ACK5H1_07630 [Tenacibaculum sp.]